MKKVILIALVLIILVIPFTGCTAGDLTSYDTFYLHDLTVEGNFWLTDTVWDDLRAPVNQGKLKGTADPIWSDAVGGQTLVFSPTLMKEVYFILQLPHSYKEGTSIIPHVHWVYGANTVGQSCRWGLEYWWNEDNVFLGGSNTIYVNTNLSNNDAVMPFLTSFPTIDGTGHTISSILNCRLFRDATDISDNYTSNVYLFEFDIHYEIDSIGSRNTLSK